MPPLLSSHRQCLLLMCVSLTWMSEPRRHRRGSRMTEEPCSWHGLFGYAVAERAWLDEGYCNLQTLPMDCCAYQSINQSINQSSAQRPISTAHHTRCCSTKLESVAQCGIVRHDRHTSSSAHSEAHYRWCGPLRTKPPLHMTGRHLLCITTHAMPHCSCQGVI
jgi:hypothetical protein